MLNPSSFDDGAQICALDTTLRALALLTSNGNGGGGGDYALPHDPKLDMPPKKYENWQAALDAGWQPRDRTPMPQFRLAGSWAGDPIATCGDYGDPGKWVTPSDYKRVAALLTAEGQDEIVSDAERGKRLIAARIAGINLHAVACRLYENISDEVATMLGLCGVGPRAKADKDHDWIGEIDEYLNRYVIRDFQEMRQVARINKRGKTYGVYDLTCLPLELLDSLMRSNAKNAGQLNSLKRWLLKQKLSPMIRELIPCYRPDCDDPEWSERHNFHKIEQIMIRHGCFTQLERDHNKRVLPPRPLLNAAMGVFHLLGDGAGKITAWKYAQLLCEMLQRQAIEEAPVTERERVVDLTAT